MRIGNKIIDNSDLFFWVEEGQASLGNFETAMKYIKAASDAGADGVEFQLALADEFYISSHRGHEYYRKIQYSDSQIKELIDLSKELNISFISAVLSQSLVPLLAEYGCDAFVINASDINNPGIIDPVVESKVPFFISLPLAEEEEIEWIVNRCKSKGADNFVLMLGQHTMASGDHGVMPEDSNLGYISTLKARYGVQVGYIDHSTSSAIPSIARAAGANFISKHIVFNREDKGPDWFVCQEPDEMKATIDMARKVNKSLSATEKVLAPGEHLDKKVMRRSIVADTFIAKGTKITREMLTFKRPGQGMPPHQYESLIGKIASKDILKDEILTLEIFE